MGRVEKFRQKRNLRHKYLFGTIFLSILLTAGILSVDCSSNYLLKGRSGIALAVLNNRDSYLEIVLMNQKFYVNTQYINRDIERAGKELQKLF